ncbi:MAG: hypothetical protein A2Z03_08840 [Chloroflexi bacterium RBG_16_56_8]|nr:MAG: hypothetical protein A2Z03_08840 [Chloroflexi bacterium RBG_16_56_8]
MKHCLKLWSVSLFAVILATACAPAASPSGLQTESPFPSAAPTAAPTATSPAATQAAPTPTVQIIATSRGPDLEATNPTSVSLASGGLQLVEFFRFT